ncbi:hypothetical protein C0J52_18833 [Blattella germanica]|nr:hypothetical protein C0J52_18833 [Blattella germanica]
MSPQGYADHVLGLALCHIAEIPASWQDHECHHMSTGTLAGYSLQTRTLDRVSFFWMTSAFIQ